MKICSKCHAPIECDGSFLSISHGYCERCRDEELFKTHRRFGRNLMDACEFIALLEEFDEILRAEALGG